MNYSSKKCFRCAYFNRYYTRGVRAFHDTKFGWCGEKQKPVVNTGGCIEFVQKRKRPQFKECLQVQLSRLLSEISAIRKIIEEDLTND